MHLYKSLTLLARQLEVLAEQLVDIVIIIESKYTHLVLSEV